MDGNLVQVGVAGILTLMILDRVFGFLKSHRERSAANGEDPDGACLITANHMARLMESVDSNTKALKVLLEHSEETRRTIIRCEKQLDRFDH